MNFFGRQRTLRNSNINKFIKNHQNNLPQKQYNFIFNYQNQDI